MKTYELRSFALGIGKICYRNHARSLYHIKFA